MTPPQEPRPCPSCGRTLDHLGCTCQTCCPASAMTTNADPQEPRTGSESFAVGDRERAATGGGAVGAPGVPVAATDQEPRTGGASVSRIILTHGADYYTTEPLLVVRPDAEPGTWFPLAEAEALIDPNDPAVRERIAQLAEDIDPVHPVAIFDAVLAALRSKP